MRRALAVAALCLVCARHATAQQPRPSVGDAADRPGFADTPILLGPGQIRIESGLQFEREAGDGPDLTRSLTWPQLEVHAGLRPRLEVSFAWDGLVSTVAPTSGPTPDRRVNGSADVRLGAKVGLADGRKGAAALIGYVYLPVGSDAVSSGYADSVVRLAWTVTLADRVGLSGTADVGASRGADGRVRVQPAVSAAVSTTLVKRLDGYFGLVAQSPGTSSRPNVGSVEAGVVLPLGVLTQIDVWGSRRFAGGPRDWAGGVGIVRRLR